MKYFIDSQESQTIRNDEASSKKTKEAKKVYKISVSKSNFLHPIEKYGIIYPNRFGFPVFLFFSLSEDLSGLSDCKTLWLMFHSQWEKSKKSRKPVSNGYTMK